MTNSSTFSIISRLVFSTGNCFGCPMDHAKILFQLRMIQTFLIACGSWFFFVRVWVQTGSGLSNFGRGVAFIHGLIL